MNKRIVMKIWLLVLSVLVTTSTYSQICTTVCKANTAKKYYVSGFDATAGNVTSILWQVNPLSGAVLVGATNQDTVAINFTNVPAGGIVQLTCTANNNCGFTPVSMNISVVQCDISTPDTVLKIPVGPGTPIPIGPSLVPVGDEKITARIEGPFRNSGVATVDPMTGLVSLTPNDTLFVGKDTIRRIVCKTPGSCDTSLILIDNPAPIYTHRDTTPINTPVSFAALTPIIFSGTPQPPVVSPRLKINPDGTVTYTPLPGFVGIDTATIVRCDNAVPANCVTDRYIMTVIPDAPNTNTSTPMGTPISVGNPVTLGPSASQELQGPKHGTVATNPDGTLTYTPSPKFVGIDTIRQIVCVNGICDTALHLIRVTPKLEDVVRTIAMNTSSTIPSPGITPGPGTSLEYTLAGGPINGTATINPMTGAVTYTPRTNFIGRDTVKIRVCVTYPDNMVRCTTAAYIFTVTPVSADTGATTKEGSPVVGGKPVSRIPGTSTTISTLGPKNGNAVINRDGTVLYTPRPGFYGKDTVWRVVCVYDSVTFITICDTARIIFTVLPNQADDSKTTDKGISVTGGKPITRIPGTSTSISTLGPKNGTVVVNPDGTVLYTPSANFVGRDTVWRIVCVYDSNTRITICDTSLIALRVVTKSPNIPNYISPNGDGVNDVWNIDELLDVYSGTKVLIYNRWGNIVWRSTGPYGRSTSGANVWYGQLEGSQDPVPDGVYYYLLEIEDEFKTTKTGFIEVMRQ